MRTRLDRAFGDDAGQAVILIAASMVMLFGLMAFAVDVGRVLNAHKQLQAATDAAATAAAQDLPTKTRSEISAKAEEYSAKAGQKNQYSDLPGVTVATTYSCLATVPGLPSTCSTLNPAQANALVVTSQASVSMTFARVLGINSMAISATATAAMKTGVMPPLDVIIVLDSSFSMNGTPLAQAKTGIRSLLNTLWPCAQAAVACGGGDPPVDKVGLFIFPGLDSTVAGNVGREYDCNGSPNPVKGDYGASPIFEIIPMTNDYRTSTTSGFNPNSNYVKAADGRSGCAGLEITYNPLNPLEKVSYFAAPLAQAQAKLASAGRPNVQDVIIFISDGDANKYTGGPSNPCQQAVSAAQAAAAAGTWVYSIGYGVSSGGCSDDSTSITALQTMQRINSDYPSLTTGKFYNAPSGGDLTDTFARIGTDLTTTRLLP